MKTTPFIFLFALLFTGLGAAAQGPCKKVAEKCDYCYNKDFIGDGQEYQATVNGDEEADFGATFFGGNTYRVAACTNDDQALLFKVIDQAGNVLYDNREFSNAKYWDFVVANTMDCRVVAQLDPDKSTTGCAVIMIGFQQ